jgi:tetrahydromethanopterin S-methyltransferase subunit F
MDDRFDERLRTRLSALDAAVPTLEQDYRGAGVARTRRFSRRVITSARLPAGLAAGLVIAVVAVVIVGTTLRVTHNGSAPATTGTAPATTGAAAPVSLGISNGTTLEVTLFVNGERVADYPPGGPQPSIDSSSLPALPWIVEARSPSGRVLTSMQVKSGDVQTTALPNGGVGHSGDFARVDLSCGRLTIWAGDIEPSGPAPNPSSGSPGDCAP